MKKLAFLLVLVVVATQVFGQKKKKQSAEEIRIDSLTTAVAALTLQLDSVSKEKEIYYGVYSTLKDEVIKYNFDPSKTIALIDSVKATRDSTNAYLLDSSAVLKDSLSVLITDNKQLKAQLDSLKSVSVVVDVNTDNMVKELKQLKELLDAKIINQEDFDSKKSAIMEKWQ